MDGAFLDLNAESIEAEVYCFVLGFSLFLLYSD